MSKIIYVPNCTMSAYGVREYGGHVAWIDGGKDLGKFYRACVVDRESKANVIVRLNTVCPADVAAVCGCKVEDLPDLVQHHYYSDRPYDGNHLLDRLDPVEWVVRNYLWDAISFVVAVCFSRRSYNKKRRELGLDPITDWDALKRD